MHNPNGGTPPLKKNRTPAGRRGAGAWEFCLCGGGACKFCYYRTTDGGPPRTPPIVSAFGDTVWGGGAVIIISKNLPLKGKFFEMVSWEV